MLFAIPISPKGASDATRLKFTKAKLACLVPFVNSFIPVAPTFAAVCVVLFKDAFNVFKEVTADCTSAPILICNPSVAIFFNPF